MTLNALIALKKGNHSPCLFRILCAWCGAGGRYLDCHDDLCCPDCIASPLRTTCFLGFGLEVTGAHAPYTKQKKKKG